MTNAFAAIPNALQETGLLLAAAFGLIGSAISSGAETGMYNLSRLKLRVRDHRGDKNARRLTWYVQRFSHLLEGLLLWQNLCGFIFSAAVTVLLARQGFSEGQTALISTLVITPVVLVLAEILPKDLFYTYADRWMYFFAPLLAPAFFVVTAIPLLPVVKLLDKAALRLAGSSEDSPGALTLRQQFDLLVEESTATGIITDAQQDIIRRALRLARLTVRDVMIPWNRVVGAPSRISRDGFLALARRYNVSRMPVLGDSPAHVLGVVQVLDVLADPGKFDLQRHIRPAITVATDHSIRTAMALLQAQRRPMAIVMDKQKRAVGLVTMKDLVEELVGDLENW